MKNKSEIKKDKYSRARGGHSRMLEVFCQKCLTPVVRYQKDGPGPLKRMYLDRIFSPNTLVGLENNAIASVPVLKCGSCKEMLGVPYIYPKEKRPAFRLFQDAVGKRIVKI